MSKSENAEAVKVPEPTKFTCEQLTRSKRGVEADVYACALKPGKTYTIEEAAAAVAAFMKKEVKP